MVSILPREYLLCYWLLSLPTTRLLHKMSDDDDCCFTESISADERVSRDCDAAKANNEEICLIDSDDEDTKVPTELNRHITSWLRSLGWKPMRVTLQYNAKKIGFPPVAGIFSSLYLQRKSLSKPIK